MMRLLAGLGFSLALSYLLLVLCSVWLAIPVAAVYAALTMAAWCPRSCVKLLHVLHILQGLFLFLVVLPASILMPAIRPTVALLIVSGYLLWHVWGDCPLNVAENRWRQQKIAGFTAHLCTKAGLHLSDRLITSGLYGLGSGLLTWWGIAWII